MADRSVIMRLSIVEDEQWWIGILLSLGDTVEVLSPLSVRERIAAQAEKILNLYHDI